MEWTMGRLLIRFHGMAKTELEDTMAGGDEGAPAHTTGHGARQRSSLHDLGEQGVSFYSPLAKQTVHGGLAVAA
jgi:hypothetical protein